MMPPRSAAFPCCGHWRCTRGGARRRPSGTRWNATTIIHETAAKQWAKLQDPLHSNYAAARTI